MDDAAWNKVTGTFPRILSGARVEKTLRPMKSKDNQPPLICGAFSPDGKMIALSGGGRIPSKPAIWIAKVPSFETVAALHGHQGVHGLAWDPKTGLLASASNDYCAVLGDLERADHVFAFGGDDEPIVKGSVAFGDGTLYIGESETFQGLNARLLRVDLATGDVDTVVEVERVDGERISIDALAVDPAGDAWAFTTDATDDIGRPLLWRGEGKKAGKPTKLDGRVRAIGFHKGEVFLDLAPEDDEELPSVAFTPDGTTVVALGGAVHTPAWTTNLDVPKDFGRLTLITCSPDGQQLVVAGPDLVVLLDAKTGTILATVKPPAWFKP